MSEYMPDGWVVMRLKPECEEEFYKIFSTWRGGFSDSDKWRLSSGGAVKDIVKEIDQGVKFYRWRQESGSVYLLNEKNEGYMSSYSGSVFKKIIETITGEIEFEVIKKLDDIIL